MNRLVSRTLVLAVAFAAGSASAQDYYEPDYGYGDDMKVNGNLTLGENIADLGGLAVAFDALQKALENKRVAEIDGYAPDQRFFMNWATVWRVNYKPEEL